MRPIMAMVAAIGVLGTTAGCGIFEGGEPSPAAASIPSNGGSPPAVEMTDGLEVRTLTPDGADRVRWERESDSGVRGTALDSTTGGSLRQVALRDDARAAVEQGTCATWQGPIEADVQPGLALRVRATEGGGTQAIAIMQNVWFSARYRYNVVLIDSEADEPIDRIGGGPIPAIGESAYDLDDLPWRMCARVQDRRLEVKVWSTSAEPTEPAWGDPEHGFAVDVPDDWVYEGRSGVYLGHQRAGLSSSYSDWSDEP